MSEASEKFAGREEYLSPLQYRDVECPDAGVVSVFDYISAGAMGEFSIHRSQPATALSAVIRSSLEKSAEMFPKLTSNDYAAIARHLVGTVGTEEQFDARLKTSDLANAFVHAVEQSTNWQSHLETEKKLSGLTRDIGRSIRAYRGVLDDLGQFNDFGRVAAVVAQRQALDRTMFSSLSATLRDISEQRSVAGYVREISLANSAFTSIAEISRQHGSLLRPLFENQSVIQEAIRNISSIAGPLNTAVAWRTSVMASQSLAAQLSLQRLVPENLGRLIGASSSFRSILADNLFSLSSTYRGVISTLEQEPNTLSAFAATVTTHAPGEILAEATILERISEEQTDEIALAVDDEDTAAAISRLLHQLNPRFSQLLVGARDAVTGRNPDRARHVTTSIRELFTQVLHTLAPSEEVRQWSSDPDHYHNGQPTRRARLLYICRTVSADPLTDFIDSDVAAALSFVNALNAGTHVVQSQLTDRQLHALVARMESLLLFVLRLRDDLS